MKYKSDYKKKEIQKQEILLLEFCKILKAIKRSTRADHVNNVDLTCFCCWDDLRYGLNTLGPLYCKQICTSFHLQILLHPSATSATPGSGKK